MTILTIKSKDENKINLIKDELKKMQNMHGVVMTTEKEIDFIENKKKYYRCNGCGGLIASCVALNKCYLCNHENLTITKEMEGKIIK